MVRIMPVIPITDRRDMLKKVLGAGLGLPAFARSPATSIEIRGNAFWINKKPTYPGRQWRGHKIEGLLMNSRMVQGVFHDENPETVSRWAYKDTGEWDPERNTREFLAAMPIWRRYGLLSFDISLQGGSPEGYSKAQPWRNSALNPDGTLKPAYMSRLKRILDRADELGMAPMVCIYYFGQDEHMNGDEGVRTGVRETVKWLSAQGYRNILLEIANECNNSAYQQPLLKPDRIVELFDEARKVASYPVSASFNGNTLPTDNVIAAASFILLHGNGVKEPSRIAEMVDQVRASKAYRGQPVLYNEDDHFDFDKPMNNMVAAISKYCSWGYFDPEGYQSPPVNWGIDTERKKGFFALLKEVTGGA
jgi:hypothetical protein